MQEKNIPLLLSEKLISLDFPSSCKINYSLSGRYMLLQSKEIFGAFDTKKLNCLFEKKNEKIIDFTFLHNETFLATAQYNGQYKNNIEQSNVYIYDKSGREVHNIKSLWNANRLVFLPYHFLLASTSTDPFLRYTDITSGKLESEIFINEPATAMNQDLRTALVYTGSTNGTVNIWSPNSKDYLCKILSHRKKITNLNFNFLKNELITSDGTCIKKWDIRNNYKPVNILNAWNNVLDISYTGNIAIGFNRKLFVYNSKFEKIKEVKYKSIVSDVKFQPYEDILTVGINGIRSVLVSNSGSSKFDAYENNPFITKKQRQEQEIKKLLEKIPIEMIGKNFSVE